MRLLRQKWWKFLCIPLLFYSFAAGISIPLGPGIINESPISVNRDTTVSVDIHTYNTHFKQGDTIDVLLKNQNNLLKGEEIVIDNTRLKVKFKIPAGLRTDNTIDVYHLFIRSKSDGIILWDNAFLIGRTDSIRGTAVNLNPVITGVSPEAVNRGTMVSLVIDCANTDFKEDDTLNIVLKNENNLLCAGDITVVTDTRLLVEYGIPADLYTENERDFYTLIIHSRRTGTFSRDSAFAIGRTDPAKGIGLKCATILENAPPAVTGLPAGSSDPTGATFPYRELLYETIRNLFFHVPMWFTMIVLVFASFVASILYLAKGKQEYDLIASSAAGVGTFFGILGILTGMLWANFTWGTPWVNDTKLNGVALGMLVYLAYFVLRGSLNDEHARARVSAVYSIFAFVIFIVFIKILPDIYDTMHPGNGGNPAFKTYDLDDTMRPVFYSAAAGFIILGCWLTSLTVRYRNLLNIQLEKDVR